MGKQKLSMLIITSPRYTHRSENFIILKHTVIAIKKKEALGRVISGSIVNNYHQHVLLPIAYYTIEVIASRNTVHFTRVTA